MCLNHVPTRVKGFFIPTGNTSHLYSHQCLWCLAQAGYNTMYIYRPFHTRTEFNVHWLCSHLNLVWGDTNWMRIEPIHLWRWIGTESKTNSLFIHRKTIKSHTATLPRTATLSKLSLLGHHTCSIRCLRYELRWPVMLGWYWLDAAKKTQFTKWSHVVRQSSRPTVFNYQRQGKGSNWTDFSVCFDTSRMMAR